MNKTDQSNFKEMKTINNNIEERLVSFPAAKLLKEVGFDCKCRHFFNSYGREISKEEFLIEDNECYVRPTQQLALDWIRVNFGIHINPITYKDCKGKYDCIIISDNLSNESLMLHLHCGWFNTPEEAKEAALEYCLTNLILKK